MYIGSPATLTCSIREARQLMEYNYSWMRNGTLLSTGRSSVISIASFSAQDAGTYVCEVQSAVGVGRGSTVLELAGDSVLHNCRGRSRGPPFLNEVSRGLKKILQNSQY